MNDQPIPEQVAIRPAATVVLSRNTRGVREVLMLRRNPNMVFVGGHYVFPGGAVDDNDAVIAATEGLLLPGPTELPRESGNAPGELVKAQGGSEDARPPADGAEALLHHAYVVAAVREAFEEAGLLLARTVDASWLDFEDTHIRTKFASYREQLNNGTIGFGEILRTEGLHINSGDLTYWSRWITPLGPPRRFDARFFVAELPYGHEASPDYGELVHSEWVRPVDALTRHADGNFPMIFPTIKTLKSMQ